jgi:hypothetical protein
VGRRVPSPEDSLTRASDNYTFGLVVGPGANVQVRAIFDPPYEPDVTYSPPSVDHLFPVTEDTSCPEQSD